MTARQRVLRALRDAGSRGCTTSELCQPDVGGVRFSARIHELRDEGHRIDAVALRPGSHRYILTPSLGQAPPPGVAPPASPASGAAPTRATDLQLFSTERTFDELCPPRKPRNAIDPEAT